MTNDFEGARNYILKREHDRHVRELEKCADDETKARYQEICRQYTQGNSVVSLGYKLTNLHLQTHYIDYERDSNMGVKSSKRHYV